MYVFNYRQHVQLLRISRIRSNVLWSEDPYNNWITLAKQAAEIYPPIYLVNNIDIFLSEKKKQYINANNSVGLI